MRSGRATEPRDSQLELEINKTGVSKRFPTILVRFSSAKPTVVYDTYWRFAHERQEIFFKRMRGQLSPWTLDPVLLKYKFTNVYRVCDRVSQYLIRRVIYTGDKSPQEVFFRTILFKLFNRIDTWELLTRSLGEVRFADFDACRYDDILTAAIDSGTRLYSAAYIMPSGAKHSQHRRKHRMHLWLLEQMMKDDLPSRLSEARSMKQAFELIRAYPSIGDFLAYQYVTDLNYSTLLNFSETSFVVAGPGCMSGIRKCFRDLGGLSEAEVIKLMAERQSEEFNRLGLSFRTLWGRPLQLIDCQNVFCEVDKYSRVVHPDATGSGRTRIKQMFRPNRNPISYWFPPKWHINSLMEKENADVPRF